MAVNIVTLEAYDDKEIVFPYTQYEQPIDHVWGLCCALWSTLLF